MDWLMGRLGVRLDYKSTEEQETYEIHLPGWMAKRKWIVDLWARFARQAITEMDEEDRRRRELAAEADRRAQAEAHAEEVDARYLGAVSSLSPDEQDARLDAARRESWSPAAEAERCVRCKRLPREHGELCEPCWEIGRDEL